MSKEWFWCMTVDAESSLNLKQLSAAVFCDQLKCQSLVHLYMGRCLLTICY